MKSATITEAKNGLSALLDLVRAGESILITDRGVPVARIEPVSLEDDPDGRLARLVRAGIVRPPLRKLPPGLLESPPPQPTGEVDIVEVLLEERRSSR